MDRFEQPLVSLEAADLVLGARNKDYGHPLDDFSCSATMITAYLKHRGLLNEDAEVTAEDVGPLMICMKLSRQANRPLRDNLVDICGYANTTQMVEEERARRQAERNEEMLESLFGDDEDEDDEDEAIDHDPDTCTLCLSAAEEDAEIEAGLSWLYPQKAHNLQQSINRARQNGLLKSQAEQQDQQAFTTGVSPSPVERAMARELGLTDADLAPRPDLEISVIGGLDSPYRPNEMVNALAQLLMLPTVLFGRH